jgi:hypothetical protein
MTSRYAVLLVLAALSMTACGRGTAQPKGEPRFASVVLTDDKERTVAKTSFAPNTPKVYAVFTLADVPAGPTVKSVWIAEQTQVAEANHRIDEASLTMGGNVTSGNFSLSRPTSGWPAGQYRVELYLGDRLGHTARFQITAASSDAATPAAATPSGPAAVSTGTIGDISFGTDVQDGRLVGTATSFDAGTRRIYAFFPFRNLTRKDTVEGVWSKDGSELYRRSDTVGAILGSKYQPTGTLWFWLGWSGGAPAGSYRFEILINGKAAGSGTFDIKS